MPIFNFATYASVREEWAIRADSLEDARARIGDDPSGDWLDEAVRGDIEPVECREFVLDDHDRTAIEEITQGHWAWRSANAGALARSLHQNIAAVGAEFHAHLLYDAFYDRFAVRLNGFPGIYDYCVSIAQALTDWEADNGLLEAYEQAGVPWIEVVEDFVETVLERATATEELPDPARVLPQIQVFAHLRGADSAGGAA